MQKSPSEKFMTGTAAVTLLCTAVFIFLYQSGKAAVWLTLSITFGTICYHFTMRLAVGLCTLRLTKYPLNPGSGWFAPKSFEKPLYEKLKVKRWKDRLPTYRPETFSLQKHTLPEIIQTICISEIGHEIMALLSFLPLLLVFPFGELPVFLGTSLAAAAADTVFVILQRYNRPRLVKAAERMKR